LLAWLTCVLFAIGLARSGTTYVFCAAMGASLTERCCPSHAPKDVTIDMPECCAERTLAKLPAVGPQAPPPPVPPAIITAAPVVVASVPVDPRPMALFVHPARAGPRDARARRATIMTWNC